jgi:endogenous inhibitor of DNA gyrase (YacG/DUF329 family)
MNGYTVRRGSVHPHLRPAPREKPVSRVAVRLTRLLEVNAMSRQRYCSTCGKDVTCKEEQGTVPGSHAVRVHLTCPGCGKILGAIYDPQLEIRPVANAKISRG